MEDFIIEHGVIKLKEPNEDIEVLLNTISVTGTKISELKERLEGKIKLTSTINNAVGKGYIIRYQGGVYFLSDDILNKLDNENEITLTTKGEIRVVLRYLISKVDKMTLQEDDIKSYLGVVNMVGDYYLEDDRRLDYKEINRRIKSYIAKVKLGNITTEASEFISMLEGRF